MGRIIELRELGIEDPEDIPVEITDIEVFDYVHATLSSLLKVMAKPGANTLRSLIWHSRAEARRVLAETKKAITDERLNNLAAGPLAERRSRGAAGG